MEGLLATGPTPSSLYEIIIELGPTESLFQKSNFLGKCHYTNFFRAKCSLTPKNIVFLLLPEIKLFLPSKKKNIILNDFHFWNGMTVTICLTWCGGVHFFFDLGARLFITQWPPYYAHILQGLLCK